MWTAKNTGVQIALHLLISFLGESVPSGGLTGSYGRRVLRFLRSFCTVLHSGCTKSAYPLPCSPPVILMVSGLLCKSWFHSELLFVQGMRKGSCFLLLDVETRFSEHCQSDCSSSREGFWLIWQRLIDFRVSILLCWFIALFLWHYHIFLVYSHCVECL